MFYVGIDPGINGAIAIFDADRYLCNDILPMPIAGKEINVGIIKDWLRDVYLNSDFVPVSYNIKDWYIACIEKVGAMPGQGVVSMFKFGFVTGILHGVFRALEIPLYTVTPQAWKKEILAGTDKSKQASIDYVLRAYPDVKLFRTERSRTYDHNMAEALCIAEYAKRKHS